MPLIRDFLSFGGNACGPVENTFGEGVDIERTKETAFRKERTILIGVYPSGTSREYEEDSLDELTALARTAGADVVDTVVQERARFEPSTLVGSGKVHQIAKRVEQTNARVVIFDDDLSPVQVKNLELQIHGKVIDRSGLILDIFARRARTREAQIQVELAQLEYYLPRLTRQWTHLSRQEGGIGTRGPGETQLEVDRRSVRKRIGHLKKELEKIEHQRDVRRKRRAEFQKVAIIGYTNAGKSSLLNALAHSDVFVENRLFATLDATIRVLPQEPHRKILLIDTVGFIRKLPHHLVASFRSTLEETVDADLLLHVVDVSRPRFDERIGVVHDVLRDMEIGDKPALVVFNKVDCLEDRSLISDLAERFPRAVFTSAVRGIGLDNLRKAVEEQLAGEEVEEEVVLPIASSPILSRIFRLTRVIEQHYENDTVRIRFRSARKNMGMILHLLEKETHDTNPDRG